MVRFLSNAGKVSLLALFLNGCSYLPFSGEDLVIEPWVAPYEREYLADPIMDINRDPVFSAYRQHVYDVREGARGAGYAQGSGCGCN